MYAIRSYYARIRARAYDRAKEAKKADALAAAMLSSDPEPDAPVAQVEPEQVAVDAETPTEE